MNVAWALKQVPQEIATPEMIYDIYRRHKLEPESIPLAYSSFQTLAATGEVYQVMSEDVGVATVILSGIIPGERADIDIIPVSNYFRGGYKRDLREAMAPIWDVCFNEHNVRRVTSTVPASRKRTVRALKAMGFRVEGVLRDAAKIVGRDPEDLILLGLLPSDLED